MKFKPKASWIGIFLIGTMLFSTFAYAIIQSFSSQQEIKIPDTNIVDSRLDPNFKEALIRYGRTVVTLEYSTGCDNCLNQKGALEVFANQYKEQVWLEELIDENLDSSKITVVSAYGEESLVDANETQIVNSLCNLMIYPPAQCALQRT